MALMALTASPPKAADRSTRNASVSPQHKRTKGQKDSQKLRRLQWSSTSMPAKNQWNDSDNATQSAAHFQEKSIDDPTLVRENMLICPPFGHSISVRYQWNVSRWIFCHLMKKSPSGSHLRSIPQSLLI